ncbi:MAG: aldo/keto reductase [Cyanobacteria bacterium J06641_5]
MAKRQVTRRNLFLMGLSGVSALGTAAVSRAWRPSARQVASSSKGQLIAQAGEGARDRIAAALPTEMPQRILGRTAVTLPILGLGGSASPLSRSGQEKEAIALVERALELGVRYFDTAANYGPSEERLGKVLPAQRESVFIASKTSKRDRDGAWRQLETTLKRLQTNTLDLWQFHALTYDWDLDTILDRKNGAIAAAEEAREQGLVKFLGITGHHNPDIIAKGLRRYPFDTALVPINAADIHTPSPFIKGVLPVAEERDVGIIAMKVPAYGRLLQPGVLTGMGQAMGYALSQPGVRCCIIAADTLEQLEENVRVAKAFQPLSTAELTEIESKTVSVWGKNSFFRDWA